MTTSQKQCPRRVFWGRIYYGPHAEGVTWHPPLSPLSLSHGSWPRLALVDFNKIYRMPLTD